MSIGEQGRQATLKNALACAARFGFSKYEALHVADQIRSIVCNWRKHYENHEFSTRELDMLMPSFEACLSHPLSS